MVRERFGAGIGKVGLSWCRACCSKSPWEALHPGEGRHTHTEFYYLRTHVATGSTCLHTTNSETHRGLYSQANPAQKVYCTSRGEEGERYTEKSTKVRRDISSDNLIAARVSIPRRPVCNPDFSHSVFVDITACPTGDLNNSKIPGVAVANLACSPPTKTNRVQSPAGSRPDFRMWKLCRTMPIVLGFSRGSPVPTLPFRRCSTLTSLTLIGSQGLYVARFLPQRTWFNPRPGHSRIFVCGNSAGRCRCSAGFLGDLPFPSLFHSGAAPYSLQLPSSVLKTLLLRAAQISSLTHSVRIPTSVQFMSRQSQCSRVLQAPSRTVGFTRRFHTVSSIQATNTLLAVVPQSPVVDHNSLRSRTLVRRPSSKTAGRWVAACLRPPPIIFPNSRDASRRAEAPASLTRTFLLSASETLAGERRSVMLESRDLQGGQTATSASFQKEGRARWVSDYGAGQLIRRQLQHIQMMSEKKADLERRLQALLKEREALNCALEEATDRIVVLEQHIHDQELQIRKWELFRTMPLVDGLYRESPVSHVLSFCRCSLITSFTIIGSQDLDGHFRMATGWARQCTGHGITLQVEIFRSRSGDNRRIAGLISWKFMVQCWVICDQRHVTCDSMRCRSPPSAAMYSCRPTGRHATWVRYGCSHPCRPYIADVSAASKILRRSWNFRSYDRSTDRCDGWLRVQLYSPADSPAQHSVANQTQGIVPGALCSQSEHGHAHMKGITSLLRLCWLDFSPPTKTNRVPFPEGPDPRTFECENRDRGCRWPAGLLGGLPSQPLDSRAAPHAPDLEALKTSMSGTRTLGHSHASSVCCCCATLLDVDELSCGHVCLRIQGETTIIKSSKISKNPATKHYSREKAKSGQYPHTHLPIPILLASRTDANQEVVHPSLSAHSSASTPPPPSPHSVFSSASYSTANTTLPLLWHEKTPTTLIDV
ncbi:hypothetical protein PR048_012514 [Dryococelus australis]|uniref:Uncharacterized protein n=1 Tax=Dryococelus australis TaxID=614101 RepID=A0ABQ9HPL6_9NEOP|nr:hypothetical protein PR048_012514 [Dryococelus australis]